MEYESLNVIFKDKVCFIHMNGNNTICEKLVKEFLNVLQKCEEKVTIIVIEGTQEVFCFGADFNEIKEQVENNYAKNYQDLLYTLWYKLATGPYITIAHVCGKANAGGIGFVAACDIVLANKSAKFSLSEMLFGIYPACVMPFLIVRVGFQHANYMTLLTRAVSAEKAYEWGLVDEVSENSKSVLGIYLLRLKYLAKSSICEYKAYMTKYRSILSENKEYAIEANRNMFSNPITLDNIVKYLDNGKLPWS
ncbi:enoyl-CoA hydratase/isomerase [Anaeromicropila populeti]|uniref:Polyketide biosynthesis enoyl-CoA hydratase PksH n=1 Tax=Anaeromicropila populeti TaxID=37658 RepID=A0A1I6IZS7_9FIRM|nr:enoyl-CoA hydratase/isomerase [Anaeromicropila populeti]SFR72265.1 polyketide biosynthesis enoyl-CoA hydratase PksH [Anaeromicropila populeti]